MSQLFVKYNNKTVLLNLIPEKNYSCFELAVLGLEKYFQEEHIPFSFSRNPYKLKYKNSFFNCSTFRLNGKYIPKDTIFEATKLESSTFSIHHILCSKEKVFTDEEINFVLKMDFKEI